MSRRNNAYIYRIVEHIIIMEFIDFCTYYLLLLKTELIET